MLTINNLSEGQLLRWNVWPQSTRTDCPVRYGIYYKDNALTVAKYSSYHRTNPEASKST